MNEELKPCPFCGGKAQLVMCDREGNIHREDRYEKILQSELSYAIIHPIEENENCPIACCNWETIGVRLYSSKENAITAWNTRKPIEDINDRINNEMALEWDNEEFMYNLGLKKALEIVQKGGAE